MDDVVVVVVVVGIIFNGLKVMFVHSGLKDLDYGINYGSVYYLCMYTTYRYRYMNSGIKGLFLLLGIIFFFKIGGRDVD